MIRIEPLSSANFRPDALDRYQRRQEVRRVYRKINETYTLVDCPYTEDWDLPKRRAVAQALASDAMITWLALREDEVVGFVSLVRALNGPYMLLDLMHVSACCRGQGVGRQLFAVAREEARRAGAQALYISACSSEETIAFYRAMGAEVTDHPIPDIAEAEPFDLQMVCPL